MNKRNLKFFYFGGVVIVLLLLLKNYNIQNVGEESIEGILLNIFNQAPERSRVDINEILGTAIISIFSIYIFSYSFYSEVIEIGTLIFIRGMRRERFLANIYAKIFTRIIMYYFSLISMVIAILVLVDIPIINIKTFFNIFIYGLVSNSLVIYGLTLIVCTITLFKDYLIGYMTSVIINFISIILVTISNVEILIYIPFGYAHVYTRATLGNDFIIELSNCLINERVILGVILNFGVILFCYLISLKRIKTMDIY